jgi:hypothetical protein
MGMAKIMGVPKTPAKISDKNVVGSTVAAAAKLTVANDENDDNEDDVEDNDDRGREEMLKLRASKSPGVHSGDALRGAVATMAWFFAVVVGDTTKHSVEPTKRLHDTKESKRRSSSVMIAVCQRDGAYNVSSSGRDCVP